MQTKKQGFTLIELLVVIVIIGILATIAIPQFTGYFKKARDSERQSAVNNISTIVKVAVAGDSTGNSTYKTVAATETLLDTTLANSGYKKPAANASYPYNVGASDTEFVVAVCSEEDNGTVVFAAGTSGGIGEAVCSGGTLTLDADNSTFASSGETFTW